MNNTVKDDFEDSSSSAGTERAVGATVVRNLNLLVTLICGAGVFWVQANMVSKSELRLWEVKFEALREELTRTRMEIVTIPRWDKRLDDIETRLKDIERSDGRRYPARSQ